MKADRGGIVYYYTHCTYGEEEVVSELEHPSLQLELAPHQLEVVLGEERLGGREVDAAGHGGVQVAVAVHGAAARHGRRVHGDDEHVVEQVRDAVADAEALQEHVQQRPRRRPRVVHARQDHRPVVRRSHARHGGRQARERRGLFVVIGVCFLVDDLRIMHMRRSAGVRSIAANKFNHTGE
jgi:hypothetical protein